MSQYVTVPRSDKSFNDYLLGDVPHEKNLQSIPVKGFNDFKFRDQVTFQLVEKKSLGLLQWPGVLVHLLRLKWLTLTLTPVIFAVSYMFSIGFEFSAQTMVLIGACIFSSHACVFILNDFYDHVFGIDTVVSNSGTRVIQNAWMTARQIKTLGYVFLFLSVSTGVGLSIMYGYKLLVLGAIGLFMSCAYSYFSKFKRFLGLNGFLINMFMGPFLVIGISWGFSNYINVSLIVAGLLFGLLAYLCISYRHLENLFLSKNNFGTSIVEYLGFDKAKVFLLGLVLLIPFVYFTLCFSFIERLDSPKNLCLLVPLFFYVYLLFMNLNLKTSIGSSISFLREYIAYLHCINGLSLVVYFLL